MECKLLADRTVPEGVTKLPLISDDPGKLKAIERLVRESGMPCETVYSEWNYYEILPPGRIQRQRNK